MRAYRRTCRYDLMKRRFLHSFWLACALIAGVSNAHAATSFEAFIEQGRAQLQAGRLDQALDSGQAAVKLKVDRWEGYALLGDVLLNLKRYEDAADALSKAIDRAPEIKQPALRDQRRQCLLAESGYPAAVSTSVPVTAGQTDTSQATDASHADTSQAEIVLWKSIENSHDPADFQSYLARYPSGAFAGLARSHLADSKTQVDLERQRLEATLTWTDSATGLMWARYNRPSEYAHANFKRAMNHCAALRLLGHADWRLPTADEFMRIYHFTADTATVRLDGDLAANQEILRYLGFWTATPGDKDGEHVLVFEGKPVSSRNGDRTGRVGGWLGGHDWDGAIVCVRGQQMAEHR
jgi:tetratricopeptide (TPR) repeat protein